MKRKVVKQAGGAYTITLPIEWVRDNGIKKGCEVDLKINGKSLHIRNEGDVKVKKIKINVSGFNFKKVYLHLNSLYSAGFDEIEVVSDKDISSLLVRAVDSLLGYALVSSCEGKCVLKDIGGGGNADLNEIFKRVFQAVLQFYENCIDDIFGEEKETQEGSSMRDKEINKLCLYLERSINKMSFGNSTYERSLFTYAFELERIADNIIRLWRANIIDKPKKSGKLNDLALDVKKMLANSFDLFYNFNSTYLEKSYTLRENVRKAGGFSKGEERLSRYMFEINESVVDLNPLILMMRLVEK